jgi:anti-repressor protein
METKEIVPIIDDGERQYVDARTLHIELGIGRDFSNWIKDRIEKYGFIEGIDFSPKLAESTGGRPGIDYHLSINMAKELAIVENNDRGREVRQYLIKVETAWNTPAMVMARALQCSSRMITEYKNQIEIMKPKVESFDALQRSEKTMSITQTAKYFKLHPKTEVSNH